MSPGLALQAPGGIDRHRKADAPEKVEILKMVAISKGMGQVQVMRAGQLQSRCSLFCPRGWRPVISPVKKRPFWPHLRGNEPIRPQFLLQRGQQKRQGTAKQNDPMALGLMLQHTGQARTAQAGGDIFPVALPGQATTSSTAAPAR